MTVLTWSDDPKTTQTIQWRTAVDSNRPPLAVYREKNAPPDRPWSTVEAASTLLEDRNIANDRRVQWHTAVLRGLTPNAVYEYCLGVDANDAAKAVPAEFRTAPAEDAPFVFLWMSDNHNREDSIPLLKTAWERHPDAAFLTISGDLVGTGQHRDDWDQIFFNYGDFLKKRPLVPSIGNHDAIDGLGSDLYRALFTLPDNGPEGLVRGQSYSLRYGNLLLISLDVTDDVPAQSAWLDETLAKDDAQWKVAVLHFPPYAFDEDYPEIRSEWGTCFDRHGVDLVLSGHVHYYQRSKPLRAGEIVAPGEGVVYLISVAVSGRPYPAAPPDYAEKADFSGIPTCQAFVVEDKQLTLYAYAASGEILDTFTLKK